MLSPTWQSSSFRAMGTDVHIVVTAPDPEPLLADARDEIERLEDCWSRFRPESELCRLNDRAGTGPVGVSELMWDALVAAYDAWHRTRGRFDPTCLDALERLGYDRTFREIDPDARRPATPALPLLGLADIELDRGERTVNLPGGLRLDLGGIGKGLAADRVAERLLCLGAGGALVSIGGDMRATGYGPHEAGSWTIPIIGPDAEEPVFEFPLIDEAITCSTTTIRRWRMNERIVHHLIDPATGGPTEGAIRSAIVTGPSAALAESLAKAALIAGPDHGLALVRGEGYDAWLFLDNGRILTTIPADATGLAA